MKRHLTLSAAGMLLALAAALPAAAAPANGQAALWDLHPNPAAHQADAWFEHYTFHDGQVLHRLKLHYATLGTPHRDARGEIDNAVLVLHWTGSDSRNLLGPVYMKALFDPGRPLDAGRYYLIFPDNLGHGQSSKRATA